MFLRFSKVYDLIRSRVKAVVQGVFAKFRVEWCYKVRSGSGVIAVNPGAEKNALYIFPR